MSDEKKVNPMVKMALELGPIVIFFIAYGRMKDKVFLFNGVEYQGFIAVTAIFVPLLMLTTFILYKLSGRISVMQILTLVLVVVFGGLGIYFNDERFFKMKPTMIYLLFGGMLGFGILRGQSYLKLAMDGAMPMNDIGWMILTKRFCAFFFGLAIVNEVIWRNFSTDTWVNFKTFGLTIAIFAFVLTQGKLIQKYGTQADSEED